jgi:alpha-1,3-mannosyltransferase
MNVLLFAPALLLLMCKATSLRNVISSLAVAAALQLGLAVPFLNVNAWGYVSRSFDLGASSGRPVRIDAWIRWFPPVLRAALASPGRKFVFYWSVNFKFLPEAWFLSKEWVRAMPPPHQCDTQTSQACPYP